VALNFLGLGFSFGAKDMGLERLQEKFASGFADIGKGIDTAQKAAQPGLDALGAAFADVGTVMAETEVRANQWSQSFSAAFERPAAVVDGMTRTLGTTFRDSWKRGTEATRPFARALMKMGDFATGFVAKFKGTMESLKIGSYLFKKRGYEIQKTLRLISDGFEGVRDVVRDLGQVLNVNKLRNFMASISTGMLGNISNAIKKLGVEGLNLTNALEARGAGAAKSARQAAANLGLTGKELSQVSSQAAGMSIGLEIGAETAAQAIVGFKDSMEEMRAVGISSAASLAKLAEVSGVNAKEFSLMLKNMSKMGLAGDQIKNVVGSFTAMGRVTGDVGGALGALPEILEHIGKQLAITGGEMDPKRMAEFAAQTAGLAAGLGKMGLSADKARGTAMELAGSIVEAQEHFYNLTAGTAEDLPALAKELAISTGQITGSFEMMRSGPQGFVEGLMNISKEVKASGGNVEEFTKFLRARLKQAGIGGIDPLINLMTQADDTIFAAMKTTEKATDSVGKLGEEGHTTGRTLQEAFEMAQQQMETSFRSIGNARQKFVRDSVKEFGRVAQSLKAIAAKGGPMGEMVTLMSDMHSLGSLALLPETLRPMAAVLGTILQQIGPIIAGFGALVMFFPKMMLYLGPVVAILGFFTTQLLAARMETDSWAEAFTKAGENIKAKLSKWGGWITGFFDKVGEAIPNALDKVSTLFSDWLDRLLETGVGGQSRLLDSFLNFAKSIGKNLGKVGKAFLKFGAAITGALAKAAETIDWADFFQTLFASIGRAVSGVGRFLLGAAKAIMRMLAEGFGVAAGDKSVVGQIISNLLTVFTEVASGLVSVMKSVDWGQLVTTVFGVITGFFAKGNELIASVDWMGVVDAIFKGIGTAFKALAGSGAGSLLGTLANALIGRVAVVGEALLAVLGRALEWLGKADWSGLLGMLLKLAGGIVEAAVGAVGQLVGKLPDILGKLATALSKLDWGGIIGAVFETVFGLFRSIGGSGIIEALKGIADQLGKNVGVLGEAIVEILEAAIDYIGKVDWAGLAATILSIAVDIAAKLLERLVGLVGTLLGNLPSLLEKLIVTALGIVKTLPARVGELLSKIGPILGKLLKSLIPIVLKGLVALVGLVLKLPGMLWNALPEILKGLKSVLSGLLDVLKNIIFGLLDGIMDWLKEKFPAFAKFLEPAIDAIKGYVEGAYAVVETVFGWLADLLGGVADWVGDVWEDIFGGAGDETSWLSEQLDKIGNHPFWTTLRAIGDFIANVVVSEFNKMVDTLKVIWGVLELVGGVIYDVIVVAFKAMWVVVEPIWGALKIGATIVWEALKLIGYVIYKVLVIAFKVLKGIALAVWDRLKEQWDTAVAFFSGLFQTLVATVAAYWMAIKDIITGVWTNYIKPIWDPIAEYFKSLFSALWGVIEPYWTRIKIMIAGVFLDYIKPVWDKVSNFFGDIFGNISEKVDQAIEDIVGFFSNWRASIDEVFGSIEAWVDELFGSSISDDIKKDLEKSFNFFKKTFDKIKSIGQRLFNWFRKKWYDLKTTAVAVWVAIVDKAKDVKRQVKMAMQRMVNEVASVLQGIKSAAQKAWDDIVRTAGGIWERIKKKWGDVKQWFVDLFAGLVGALIPIMAGIYAAVVNVWDDGKGGGIKGVWGKIPTFFKNLWNTISTHALKIWDKIKEKVGKAMKPMISLFEKIDAITKRIFTNSIHDDVKHSMDLSAKYMASGVGSMNESARQMSGVILTEFQSTFGAVANISESLVTAVFSGINRAAQMVNVESALTPILGFFETLDEWLNYLFRESIQTDVASSMAASADEMTMGSDKLSDITAAWGQDFEKIYQRTFSRALRRFAIFKARAVLTFAELGKDLVAEFQLTFMAIDLLSTVTTMLLDYMKYSLKDSMDIMHTMLYQVDKFYNAMVKSIQIGDRQLKEAAEEATKKAKEGDPDAPDVQVVTVQMDPKGLAIKPLINAVNNPTWWKESKAEFKALAKAWLSLQETIMYFLQPRGGRGELLTIQKGQKEVYARAKGTMSKNAREAFERYQKELTSGAAQGGAQ